MNLSFEAEKVIFALTKFKKDTVEDPISSYYYDKVTYASLVEHVRVINHAIKLIEDLEIKNTCLETVNDLLRAGLRREQKIQDDVVVGSRYCSW